MSEHTPGPWLKAELMVYALEHDGWHKGVEQFRNRFWAGLSGSRDCGLDEMVANANLIAAAPDLLAELQRVMSWIKNWGPEFTYDPEWKIDEEKARAAIAKAKGEA